ncbi:MAG TPA: FlgD immunoglobulin-like domain containing protein, partial [candidate division Zixibacteria bacterium]|nr:FlgD immunoglobulin-like domain containing protein [candidate division Zixibacteria bacterium]
TLEIFNTLGQRVRTLVDGLRGAQRHTVYWAGDDDDGAAVASGVYFYRLKYGSRSLTRKMTLVR